MKLKIDEEADALHLELVDVPVEESEEVAPGVIVDYDASNQVVGIEILYLSKHPHPVNLMAFHLLHLHGRAFHALWPQAVDDMARYTWVDGEVVCGMALGWNFGDGHLHHEQLLRAIQAQCDFDEGELRCIFLEPQAMLGRTQQYRIHDAKTGELTRGEFSVEEMQRLQPWPHPGPGA
jgi:uncharacterized protein YuzE